MYKGKTAAKLAEEKKKKKQEAARAEVEKNVVLVGVLSRRLKTPTRISKATYLSLPKGTRTRLEMTPVSDRSSTKCARNSM